RRVLLRPAQHRTSDSREIHHHVTAPRDQRLHEPLPEKLAQIRALQIAVIGQGTEELLPLVIVSVQQKRRLPMHQRRRVPVDDRTDVVLIKHAAQPLQVHLVRLPVSPHQVFGGSLPQLFTACVEVLVMPPHRLSRDVFRMLPVNCLYAQNSRPPRSPIVTAGRHSCQSRYPKASDKWVRIRSLSLSICPLSVLYATCSKSLINSLHRGSISKSTLPDAARSLVFVRLIRSRTAGFDFGT